MTFNSLLKHMMLLYSAVFYDIFQSQFEQIIVSLIHHVNNTIMYVLVSLIIELTQYVPLVPQPSAY